MQSRNSKANCSAYTAKCTVILCVLEKYTSHLNSGAGGEERDFIKPGYKHLNPGDTIGHRVIVISRFYNKSHGNEKWEQKTWYRRRHNYDVGIRHGDHKNSGYDEYCLTTIDHFHEV